MRRADGLCWECGREAIAPSIPPAVPVVTAFKDVPAAAPHSAERAARYAAILWELVHHAEESHEAIAKRLGVARTTVSWVAGKHGLSRAIGRPDGNGRATHREQLRRLVMGGPEGKKRVA